jgi:hypothetical protein
MPLAPNGLKGPIVAAFQKMQSSQASNPSFLFIHEQLCRDVAKAYDAWFKGALGDLMPVITPGPNVLVPGMRAPLMTGWGAAFASYSVATRFTPVGVEVSGVITNASAQASILQAAITSLMPVYSPSIQAFGERIAALLSTYTTGLMVQVTLSVPPGTKTGVIT